MTLFGLFGRRSMNENFAKILGTYADFVLTEVERLREALAAAERRAEEAERERDTEWSRAQREACENVLNLAHLRELLGAVVSAADNILRTGELQDEAENLRATANRIEAELSGGGADERTKKDGPESRCLSGDSAPAESSDDQGGDASGAARELPHVAEGRSELGKNAGQPTGISDANPSPSTCPECDGYRDIAPALDRFVPCFACHGTGELQTDPKTSKDLEQLRKERDGLRDYAGELAGRALSASARVSTLEAAIREHRATVNEWHPGDKKYDDADAKLYEALESND